MPDVSQSDDQSSASSWFSKLTGALPSGVAAAANDLANDIPGFRGAAAVAQKGLQKLNDVSLSDVAGKAKGLANSAQQTISENAISRQRWTTFFGGALLGCVLMSLAFAFLPMIVFAPQKFALLFTLGSVCFLASFAALRGHSAFLRHLISRSRAPFTAIYTISMVGTLWASLMYRSYLLTMVFSAIQVSALSWFLVSYIPGGKRALGFVTSMAWRLCKGCCRCASKGSLLPF